MTKGAATPGEQFYAEIHNALLTEYARNFQARLNFIEVPHYQEMLDTVRKAAVAPDSSLCRAFAVWSGRGVRVPAEPG